jgi:hypothetical protein
MLRWISIFGGLLIMMEQYARSEALFYYFRLEDWGRRLGEHRRQCEAWFANSLYTHGYFNFSYSDLARMRTGMS